MYLSLVFRENDTLLILSRQVEKRILDTLMDPKVYDARIRPSGANDTDSATVVIVNIFVRSFSKIDDVKMVSSCASHINLSNRNIISIFIKWWFYKKTRYLLIKVYLWSGVHLPNYNETIVDGPKAAVWTYQRAETNTW